VARSGFKWHALIPARRNAVLRPDWGYIDVSTRWTTQKHAQSPADFRQKVTAVALASLASQLPLVPFNRKPGAATAGGRGIGGDGGRPGAVSMRLHWNHAWHQAATGRCLGRC